MSWHWSRLSILAFLALLYASPLSSGDKGLWLSVTSMAVPLFGALPGGMPPEHSILLPNRGGSALGRACVQRLEPALRPGPIDVDTAIEAIWTTVSRSTSWSTPDAIGCAPAAPRGPPGLMPRPGLFG